MISHYYTKQGHSAWMRCLPVPVAEVEKHGGLPESTVTDEMLQRALEALARDEPLKAIAEDLGVTYHALHHQLKRGGHVRYRKDRIFSPPLEDFEPFVEWLRANGMECKKQKGSRMYNVRLTNQTRYIQLIDGKIKLGPGLNYRYADFCRERENGRVQS